MKNEKKITRRKFIKDSAIAAAGVSALAVGSTSGLGLLTRKAHAMGHLRAEILKIPGVGMGSPTDADWQKVGAMCLGGTKSTVKEGEFKGVKLTFMGLNNQNLHNFLFRGFLKSSFYLRIHMSLYLTISHLAKNSTCNQYDKVEGSKVFPEFTKMQSTGCSEHYRLSGGN